MTDKAPNKPSIDYVRFNELMAEKKWGAPELAGFLFGINMYFGTIDT